MTPQEFKSWFEGFTEALTGVPTKAQWARIKERVAEIDGKPTTERIYIDRYMDRYWSRPYWAGPYWGAYGIGATTMGSMASNNMSATSVEHQNAVAFNSVDAMAALGKADYQATVSK